MEIFNGRVDDELNTVQVNNCIVDAASPSLSLQALQLLPEIRIDTSRLDEVLSSFQQRLGALERAFSKVAKSAADAAHKVRWRLSQCNKGGKEDIMFRVSVSCR